MIQIQYLSEVNMTYRQVYEMYDRAEDFREFAYKKKHEADNDDYVAEVDRDDLAALFDFITDVCDFLDNILNRDVE